jgi:hypothetical protein
MLPSLAAGKGSTVFLPAEAAGMMGALGGIKELLTRTAGTPNPESGKSAVATTQARLPRIPGDLPPGLG